jgi:hypothetical protein
MLIHDMCVRKAGPLIYGVCIATSRYRKSGLNKRRRVLGRLHPALTPWTPVRRWAPCSQPAFRQGCKSRSFPSWDQPARHAAHELLRPRCCRPSSWEQPRWTPGWGTMRWGRPRCWRIRPFTPAAGGQSRFLGRACARQWPEPALQTFFLEVKGVWDLGGGRDCVDHGSIVGPRRRLRTWASAARGPGRRRRTREAVVREPGQRQRADMGGDDEARCWGSRQEQERETRARWRGAE